MKPKKRNPTDKQQLGIRVSNSVIVDTKILAIRQNRRLNEVVEEALDIRIIKLKRFLSIATSRFARTRAPEVVRSW